VLVSSWEQNRHEGGAAMPLFYDLNILMHTHHIIPKHIGGSNDPSNLIELTVEQHAEAHRILFEKYGRWEDRLAWLGLSGCISKEELHRERSRQAQIGHVVTEETRQKISKNNGMKNPLVSKKTSIGMIGNKNSIGHPNGASNKGQIWITNGKKNKRIFPTDQIPEGYRRGRE
jgi:hypothetical protein